MLILILVFYVLPVYLVFFHFKWIALTPIWKIVLPLPPLIAFLLLWFALARYTPIVQDAYVQAPVTQIAPQVSGEVAEVLVRDNAVVKAGDPLFRISPEPFQFRSDQARARLLEVKEQSLGLVANLYVSRETQKRAEASLWAARKGITSAEADLMLALASIAKVEALIKLADAEVERAAKLLASNAISREEYDQRISNQAVYSAELDEARQRELKARAAIDVAQAQVLAAEAIVRESLAQRGKAMSLVRPTEALRNAIGQLESDLTKLKSTPVDEMTDEIREQISSLTTEIEEFKFNLSEAAKLEPELAGNMAATVQAENAWRIAQYDLEQTTIKAPADGLVVNLQLTPGTYINAGKPVAALMDTTTWRLVAPVPENSLGRVKIGDEVRVALRNYPLSFRQGKVLYVVPGVLAGQAVPGGILPDSQSRMGRQFDTPETSQDFQVIVSLADDRSDQPLRIGSTAHAVLFASGGYPVVNQVASFLLTIMSAMDCFVPKPSLIQLLVVVMLALGIIALVRFIQESGKR